MKIKLSPLNQRRWKILKSKKRAKLSFVFLSVIFVLSFFANFIANDKPLLVYYGGKIYSPIFNFYSEQTFGGYFETQADYHDPYVQNLIKEKGWFIWPVIPYKHDTINFNFSKPVPAPPSAENWLGTDDQGRDILARLIYGLRNSLLFSFGLTLISAIIGFMIGSIQGFFAGKVDLILQRLTETWAGLPTLYILMIVSSIIQPNITSLMIVMALVNWIVLVGVVRVEFLRARSLDYVRAARALGATNFSIMYKHIMPNALMSVIVYIPFMLNNAIITLTALDFLGFGLPPGSASLGEMIGQARNNMHAPWISMTVFFAITAMLSCLIFLGEAIRDAFDPKSSSFKKSNFQKVKTNHE